MKVTGNGSRSEHSSAAGAPLQCSQQASIRQLDQAWTRYKLALAINANCIKEGQQGQMCDSQHETRRPILVVSCHQEQMALDEKPSHRWRPPAALKFCQPVRTGAGVYPARTDIVA